MEQTTIPPDRRSGDLTVLPEVLAFMQVLWALVHRLDKTSKRMGRHVGVTGPQRLALRVVGLFPGVSAGSVAAILHVHPSTLTGVLQRLAAQNLVVRHHDPIDRRRALLRLTPRGRRINAASTGTVEAAVEQTLGEASAHDIAATTRLLSRLATNLDGQGETAAPPEPVSGSRVRRRRAGANATRNPALA